MSAPDRNLPALSGNVYVRARLHPLKMQVDVAEVEPGGTIVDCLLAAGRSFHPILAMPPGCVFVDLDGEPVSGGQWGLVRPGPGQVLGVRVVPAGGGGGGGKDPMVTVLSLAVLAASIYAGPLVAANMGLVSGYTTTGWILSSAGEMVAGMFSAGIMVAGGALISSVTPQAKLPSSSASTAAAAAEAVSPSLSITGSRNMEAPYGRIPWVMGTNRVYPIKLGEYNEVAGDDVFYRFLMLFGYGPMNVTDLRIGDTPFEDYDDFDYVVHQGYDSDPALSLYTKDVHQEFLSILLDQATGWVTRTTRTATEEITWDLFFDRGLRRILTQDDDDWSSIKAANPDVQQGDSWDTSVTLECQYRLEGGSWSDFPGFPQTYTARTAQPFRRSYRVAVPSGRYQVQWRRTTADGSSDYLYDSVYVTALRSIRSQSPIDRDALPPLTLIEGRLRTTSQVSGVIDQVNGLCTSVIQQHNGVGWYAVASSSPAWHYARVLRGVGSPKPLADERLDLDGLRDWHDGCEAEGLEINAVVSAEVTMGELLRDIAEVGRGVQTMKDNLYSVVMDAEQPTPRQVFSPRNSWGWKWRRSYADLVHGLRVRFVNADANHQEDEIPAYWPGYGEDTATNMETWDCWGVTDPEQARVAGLRELAKRRYRSVFPELYCGIEHLLVTRGDMVRAAHPSVMKGICSGRVKSVTTDGGGDVTAITVDEPCPMEAGVAYAASIRLADLSMVTGYVVNDPGEQSELAFDPAIPASAAPARGDLVTFGEAVEVAGSYVILQIIPAENHNARLVLAEYAWPAIRSVMDSEQPEWTSHVTRRPRLNPPSPPAPVIESVRSGEAQVVRGQDGSLRLRIRVAFRPRDYSGGLPVDGFFAEYRETDAGGDWIRLPLLGADDRSFFVDNVEEGRQYDLRVRTTATGLVSPWSTVEAHQVTGLSSPPPDVGSLLVDGRTLRWTYAEPPIDHRGFLVRAQFGDNRTLSSATLLHDGVLTDARFQLPELSGTWTVFVTAVDLAGNESVNPAVVVLGLGDRIVSNLVETTDLAALGFPGTISGATVDGGQLQADDTSAFWGDDANTFWGSSASLFWISVYDELVYTYSYQPDADLVGETLFLELTASGASINVGYRHDNLAPFWGDDAADVYGDDADAFWPPVPGFTAWPGEISELLDIEYEIRVTIPGGQERGVISAMALKVDVEDVVEWLDDVAIGSGGTRLALTKSFREIKRVLLTLQDDGGSAETARAMDKDETNGPLIKCFDGSGTAATGTVDAVVQGY